MTQDVMHVDMDRSNVNSIRVATKHGIGTFTPANLIRLAANRGAQRYLYPAETRGVVTPWSRDMEHWHAL